MNAALIDVLVWVLSPLTVGFGCLLTRRDSRRAILVLSLVSLALGGFDFVIFALEIFRVIPIVSPAPNYTLIDSLRIICYGIAIYVGIAAWVFALYRAARTGRLGWMTTILVVVMLAIVSAGIANDPLLFFSRQQYIFLDALIFAASGHLASLVTLIYALATHRDTIPAAPAPMMYPPAYYPPMMYPPPPYPYYDGQPFAYAPPPPPVVLPTPQPQPPTMTTPS